jgi:NAD(P)-dependent dehydrogenase (short-subunit alcohol dehydrogenase family)
MSTFKPAQWALILGGSSGFGLATAQKLSALGMSVCVVHRDRRGAMQRIGAEFDVIRAHGNPFITYNVDALSEAGQQEVLQALTDKMQAGDGVRVLLHSIAFGNLKPIAPLKPASVPNPVEALAERLELTPETLKAAVDDAFSEGYAPLYSLLSPQYGSALIEDEDMARTIYSMGSSLLAWTQNLHTKGLFAEDARVFGLTSEGNQIAWRGYAAVSAAKVALESISRSIAVEFAPYGIRSNVIQAGVTDTPALKVIPGSDRMKAFAQLRNPFGRLTTPQDVANVIALLAMDEAAWINGTIIRADGGEAIASY